MFKRSETVRVTTKEEFDAAVASARADRIEVEGDEGLLSYAARVAGGDDGLQIDQVQFPRLDPTVKSGPEQWAEIEAQEASRSATQAEKPELPSAAPARPGPAPTRMATPSHGSAAASLSTSRWLWLAVGVVVVGLVVIAMFTYVLVPPAPQPASAPPAPADDVFQSAPVPAPAQTLYLSTLAWPVVALAAIAALFLIARQAIGAGRNVEISWKVTEKVEGKLVISKVSIPAQRRKKAA